MASINKVILIGHLGQDPDLRYLASGEAVANLSLATTDKYKDKNGQPQEQTEWHRISFFGRMAEICGQYLKKGSQIYVEGSLRTRKYTDKQGIERSVTEIRGEQMRMLGTPPQRAPERHADMPRSSAPAPARAGGFDDLADGDMPF